VLELVLGNFVEAGIIAILVLFNAALGFLQEGRAQATLAALKSRLALTATVRRDGVWTNLPAADLVPGDSVKLSLGGVLALGHFRLGLGIATLQTLAFFVLVCGNQATMYAVRARGRMWSSPRPSRWLILSSVADLVIALILAGCGWLMLPLPLWVLGSVLVSAIAFTFVLDLVKSSVFSRLKIT
jgi:magnesium-transporting ATPase (P-type)